MNSSRTFGAAVPRVVVFCTQGLTDPLVYNLMLEYLFRLQRATPDRAVLLFTEEPPDAVVGDGLRSALDEAGIEWVPLRYDVSGRQWLQKLRSGWTMFQRTRGFTSGHKDAWLLGYLTFGGAYAALLSTLGLGRNITVCFEPHSRYMVEMGIWRKGGFRHRIVEALERLQLRTARALVIPTHAGVALASSEGAECVVVLQGITIDVKAAAHDPVARIVFRTANGIDDEVVLAYVGKFGGIYYSVGDYLLFAERLLQRDPTLRFLVVASAAQLEELNAHDHFAPVAERFILQPPVSPDRLHEVLSAADLGVIAVPPTPAQAFRTPVKTAHYWAAGLPIIIPEGVSDDHGIATDEGVGIVVKGLLDIDLDRFFHDLAELKATGADATRERCMAAARKHRDTGMMVAHLQRLLA